MVVVIQMIISVGFGAPQRVEILLRHPPRHRRARCGFRFSAAPVVVIVIIIETACEKRRRQRPQWRRKSDCATAGGGGGVRGKIMSREAACGGRDKWRARRKGQEILKEQRLSAGESGG